MGQAIRLPTSASTVAFRALTRLWGNEEWSASPEFCDDAVNLALETDGGIVECGSGLSTLLLCEAAPNRVLTLEHDRAWFTKVGHRVNPAASNIVYAPLRRFEDTTMWATIQYDWYDVDPKVMGDRTFSLVVVDGPPGHVCGGRYGAIPRLLPHLTPEFTVLLDDTQRDADWKLPSEWRPFAEWTDKTERVGSLGRTYMIVRGRKVA